MASKIPYCVGSGIIIYPDGWRALKEQPQGNINGLPSLRGTAIATDGVLVAILTWNGTLLVGHLDYFIADKKESTVRLAAASKPKAARAPKVMIEDFC
jgi:hypothetical protein